MLQEFPYLTICEDIKLPFPRLGGLIVWEQGS